MKTGTQKQDQSQKEDSSDLARSNRTMPEPAFPSRPILHLQRTIGNQAVERLVQVQPARHFTGQTRATPPGANLDVAGPGKPLEPALRQGMEQRFGQDLSSVQVHVNDRASESAAALGASAYTYGQHIVFGRGRYNPESGAGQRLVAHELAHTIQQRGSGSELPGKAPARESEADRAARGVSDGGTVPALTPSGLAVACQPTGEIPQQVRDIDAQILLVRQQLQMPVQPLRGPLLARLQALELQRQQLSSRGGRRPAATAAAGTPQQRLEAAMSLLSKWGSTERTITYLFEQGIQLEFGRASFYDPQARKIVLDASGSAADMAQALAFESRKIQLDVRQSEIRSNLRIRKQQDLRYRGLNYDPAWEEFYEPKSQAEFVEGKLRTVVEAAMDVIEFNKGLQRQGVATDPAPLEAEYDAAYNVTYAAELPKDVGRTWRDISPDARSKAQTAGRRAVVEAIQSGKLLTGDTREKYAARFGKEWDVKQAERAEQEAELARVRAENAQKSQEQEKVMQQIKALAELVNRVDPNSSDADQVIQLVDSIAPLLNGAQKVIFIAEANQGLERLLGPFGFRTVEGVAVGGLMIDRLEYGLGNYAVLEPRQRAELRRDPFAAHRRGIQVWPTEAELRAKDRLVAVRKLPDGTLHVGSLGEFRQAAEQNRINHALEQLAAIRNSGPGALLGRIVGGEKGAAIGALMDAGLMIKAPMKARANVRAGIVSGGAGPGILPAERPVAAEVRLPPVRRLAEEMPDPVRAAPPARVSTPPGVTSLTTTSQRQPPGTSSQKQLPPGAAPPGLSPARPAGGEKVGDIIDVPGGGPQRVVAVAPNGDLVLQPITRPSVSPPPTRQPPTAPPPQKQLSPAALPQRQLQAGTVPQIAMGDVKSINDYNRGIRHISEMEGRGKYNTNGNIGIALYDPRTGDVYLQVLGLPSGPGQPRKIIYEAPIGRVQIPAGRTPIQIGNEVEEPVRELVRRVTGQRFPAKPSNRGGPDLLAP